MVKPPFPVRQNPERHDSYLALREGIPENLLPSLLAWTLEQYTRWVVGTTLVNQDRLNRLERIIDHRVLPDGYRDDAEALQRILVANENLHIWAIDIALRWATDNEARQLGTYFDEARSEYCVRHDENGEYEIQYRQPKEISELVDSEVSQPGRAARHLRSAVSKCFGRHPDPKGACREAVEAVEVAAKSVITPSDSMPSLGKMCGTIRDKPEKWETDSEFERSVESARHMMELVWNEGRFRHGDESAPLEVSQEAAEMTVQTAVLLVSWFRTRRIRLRP